MCTCAHTHTYTHKNMYEHTCAHVCMHTCTDTHTHHAWTHAHMRKHTHTHTHTYHHPNNTHLHIRAKSIYYKRIRTHTHTHKYTLTNTQILYTSHSPEDTAQEHSIWWGSPVHNKHWAVFQGGPTLVPLLQPDGQCPQNMASPGFGSFACQANSA